MYMYMTVGIIIGIVTFLILTGICIWSVIKEKPIFGDTIDDNEDVAWAAFIVSCVSVIIGFSWPVTVPIAIGWCIVYLVVKKYRERS